jgi:hypothetical protein
MGYCVDIELRNVRFHKDNWHNIKKTLDVLNEYWHKKHDWCRFDKSLTDIYDVFKDIGFETSYDGEYIKIEEFLREKLGDHTRMFKQLAPYLEDCEIVFFGEEQAAWKVVVKNKSCSEEVREDF